MFIEYINFMVFSKAGVAQSGTAPGLGPGDGNPPSCGFKFTGGMMKIPPPALNNKKNSELIVLKKQSQTERVLLRRKIDLFFNQTCLFKQYFVSFESNSMIFYFLIRMKYV